MGLVASMDMVDNVMLRRLTRAARASLWTAHPARELAERADRRSWRSPLRAWIHRCGRLSGGNVQKVLLGREIASQPRSVLIVAYPVRGLDINSSYLHL